MKNDVWDIVLRAYGKSIVSSKWLYKIKHAIDNNIEKFNVRFVARGFSPKKSGPCGDICSSHQVHFF
jgi:hypothetical protein